MERLRQRSTIGKSQLRGQIFYKPTNWLQSPFYLTGITGGVDQTVRDQVPTPQQWKRITDLERRFPSLRKHVSPNAAQMSKIEFLDPKQRVVEYKYEDATYRITLTGPNVALAAMSQTISDPFYPTYSSTLTTVDGNVASYLYQRALAKASSAEFDFGVTIGEIAETASFLASPLQAIVKLSNKAFKGVQRLAVSGGGQIAIRIDTKAPAKAIRRIMQSSTAVDPLQPSLRLLDETANHWLAYKFGILPILDDIQKALQFKEENVRRQLGVRTAKVKGFKTDVTTSRLDKDTAWYSQTRGDFWRTKRVIDQHVFGLYFRNEITDPLANFMEGLGFSKFSIFHLAYELIPLSFVVDRFIDIKSFVKGNLGGLNKEILSYYCTRKIETVFTQNITNFQYYSSGMRFPLKTNVELAAVAKQSQMARVINVSRPNFPVINPYWRESLTADMTNLSLIWGRLRTFVGK